VYQIDSLAVALPFKFPAATGAVNANGKPDQLFFQEFMFDKRITATAPDFLAEFLRSMLIFYL
jgi:hypothetical protein